VENAAVARLLYRIADLLEISGANAFRVRAYRGAARTVESLAEPLAQQLRMGRDLAELPGIGRDLAEKIGVIVETGTHPVVAELEKQIPGTLLELLDVPGLGPKRVMTLHRELGIRSADSLLEAARSGRVRALKGFGERSEAAIRSALEKRRGQVSAARRTLASVQDVAGEIADWLRGAPGVERVEVAGSFRRCRETVGDLDVLASTRAARTAVARFVAFHDARRHAGGRRAALRAGGRPARGAARGVRCRPAVLHRLAGTLRGASAARARAPAQAERVRSLARASADRGTHGGGRVRRAGPAVDCSRAPREPRGAGGR
jgi:DNA polymerase (family 10)